MNKIIVVGHTNTDMYDNIVQLSKDYRVCKYFMDDLVECEDKFIIPTSNQDIKEIFDNKYFVSMYKSSTVPSTGHESQVMPSRGISLNEWWDSDIVFCSYEDFWYLPQEPVSNDESNIIIIHADHTKKYIKRTEKYPEFLVECGLQRQYMEQMRHDRVDIYMLNPEEEFNMVVKLLLLNDASVTKIILDGYKNK